MSISPEPQFSLAPTDETAARREQAAARREEEAARQRQEASVPLGSEGHDTGEVIAAALVRVTTLAPPGALVPGGWPGARIGVALQTVSAVNWLSAGRARGAA